MASQRSLKRPSLDEANIENITKSYVEQEEVLLVICNYVRGAHVRTHYHLQGEDGKFVVHAQNMRKFAKLGEMLENAEEEGGLKLIELLEEEQVAKVLEIVYAPYVPLLTNIALRRE
ncbi:hypothetical protein FRC08_014342 [Ceratobasidium sp. 394]|nr:hypothetical protein FRC08_014342 [Ceratobasidium sp. 394]